MRLQPARVVFIAVAALAAIPFVLLVPLLVREHASVTGSDGLFPLDQLQYMALIREAGHFKHALDHFPLFLISGLGVRAGLDVRVAFLLWVPISAAVLVWGFDHYVRTMVGSQRQRLAALCLSLFYLSPVVAVLCWTAFDHGESFRQLVLTAYYLFPAGAVWGYPQIALVLGLMPICLLFALPRTEPGSSSAWRTAVAPCAGAAVSFLHPWQGVTLLLVHAITALSSRAARTTTLLLTLGAIGAPLVFYRLASHSDPRLALTARNTLLGPAPLWVVVAALAPLMLGFVAVNRTQLRSLHERQLVLWPLVALFCYSTVDVSWQPYFLLGATLPLAILTVRAVAAAGPRFVRAGVACLLLLTLPGTAFVVNLLRQREHGSTRGFYVLKPGDRQALDYVAQSPRRGSVLASGSLAPAAWTFTGRRSWASTPFVSPEYAIGQTEAAHLFAGAFTPRVARRFVNRTRATFVIGGCGSAPLASPLRPLITSTRRFGCASVYETRG